MTIRCRCPAGHRLSVPDDWQGRVIRCARCKQSVTVPVLASHETPPAKPAVADRTPPPKEEKKPLSQPVRTPRPLRAVTQPQPAAMDAIPVTPKDRPPQPEKAEKQPQAVQRSDAPAPSVAPEAISHIEPPMAVPDRSKKEKKTAAKKRPSVQQPIHTIAYRADAGRIMTVRWLACILAAALLFSVAPVAYKAHWSLATAPGWARAVVLIALLQAAYLAWMLNRPDWTSVWVVMLVFAGVSALYGMATALAIATPTHQPIHLGMEDVRDSAAAWCSAVLLVMALVTYLSGRTAVRWRRAAELEGRGRQTAKKVLA